MNETTSDGINQLHDQHEIGVNNETQPIATDQYKVSYNEPTDTSVSVGESASSDVVQPHQEYSQSDQKEKAMPANQITTEIIK